MSRPVPLPLDIMHVAEKRSADDGENLKWLIGIAALMTVSFIIALIGSDKSISASIKAWDDALHKRINRTRDDYVRRVDLAGHVNQLRHGLKELKDETREIGREANKRLDQVLAGIAQDRR